MRYYGSVYRPPSEAYSLIVQVTYGCSHNTCAFCSMYKEKRFALRPMEEVLEDFRIARRMYRQGKRGFLADGDALVRKASELYTILDTIRELFPECERVTSYASPASIRIRTEEELRTLRDKGLTMVYMGLESGCDDVLKRMNKGHMSAEIVEMGQKVRRCGMALSVTAITGLGGPELLERHAIETAEAFNAMADSIAKSEEKRSEFVANISHELKTPMTTIAGYTDGILDGTIPPDKERAALQTISSETRRLSRLVRRMLDLSRLQSTENITAQEQFDVSEVMLRVLVSLENKINARHLDVDTQLPDGVVEVWGDPDAITQVCYNLLDNAIKFSDEGSTMGISITTKGGKAHVAVRNQGQTIPPDELAMIFDRFHKSDKSRSVDRDGVGLGLYIVKTILNNHKENITVTSQDGVTEFVFTLTLA